MAQRLRVLLLLVAASAAISCAAAQAAANVTVEPDQSPKISCRVHVVNNTESDMTLKHSQSSLRVYQAADIMDVAVVVQLQHADVSALEVALSATSPGSRAKRVVLKQANTNTRGGQDMVQTIFSDWAPNDFPMSVAEAPFSGVYRPAQPLASLSSGSGVLAGRGGSQGIWTLSVKDTRQPAAGEASTPLKLTGWELWLCGEADGPLFDPSSVKAEDGAAEVSVDVLRKSVAPSAADVAAVQESLATKAARLKQESALGRLNSAAETKLVEGLRSINTRLAATNPELAQQVNSTIAGFAGRLSKLPSVFGYTPLAGNAWGMASSAAVNDQYRATLEHCYRDLYWCWENAGLGGDLMLELTSNWEALTEPLRARWEQTITGLVETWQQLQESDPAINAWSDALFYSAIDTLYDAAAANAVYSVGEAYLQTAVRLATYLTPVRFELDIRAAVVQTYQLVKDVLNIIAFAINRLPFLVDGEVNNSIDDVLRMAETMVDSVEQQVLAAADGLAGRAQQNRGLLSSSLQQMVTNIASSADQFGAQLAAANPLLGAVFNNRVKGPLRDVAQVASAATKGVTEYFRTQSNGKALAGEFDRTVKLLGDIFVASLDNVLTALTDAEKALDPLLPGPPPSQLLADLGKQLSGILSDADQALQKLVPVEEISQGAKILDATVGALLDVLAEEVGGAAGPQGIAYALNNVTKSLQDLQKGVADTMNNLEEGFPGPLVKDVLDVIKTQSDAAADEIKQVFDNLTKDYPNLDPKTLMNGVEATLEELLSGSEGPLQLALLTAADPSAAAKELTGQIPVAFQAVNDALVGSQGVVKALLPAELGDVSAPVDALRATTPEEAVLADELQQQLGGILSTFAARVDDLTSRIPATPPLAAITGDISSRIASSAEQLASAAIPALRTNDPMEDASGKAISTPPDEIFADLLSNANTELELVLKDIQNQKGMVPNLLEGLKAGPLGPLVEGAENTLKQVSSGIDATAAQLEQLVPIPDIRQVLDNLLGAPLNGLSLALKGAAQAGVQLLNATSEDLVAGAADGLAALGGALKQGEEQVAALLEGVSTVAGLVDKALLNGTAPAGPLEDVAKAVTAQGQAATKQLAAVLETLRPPPQVLEAVLRPIGQVLDPIAGDIIKGGAALPNVTNSLVNALDRLAAVAGTVTKELGDLVSKGLFSGVSPSDVLTPPDVLLGEVVKAVGSALDEVAGNITGTVLSLPGPQQQNAATQAVRALAGTLGATQQQLAAARAAIPAPGPVLNAVLGNQDAVTAIQQVVNSLTGSTDLAAASSVLRQLLPAAPQSSVRAAAPALGSSSLVSAGQSILNDFKSSIGSWVGQFQPGAVAGAFANGFQQGWAAGGAR